MVDVQRVWAGGTSHLAIQAIPPPVHLEQGCVSPETHHIISGPDVSAAVLAGQRIVLPLALCVLNARIGHFVSTLNIVLFILLKTNYYARRALVCFCFFSPYVVP